MKRLIMFVAFFAVSGAYGQSQDSTLYAAAYKYIGGDVRMNQYSIVPSKTLAHTSYRLLSEYEIDQCNIDSLRITTEIDLIQLNNDKTSLGPRQTRSKVKMFDKKSLMGPSEILQYEFPPIAVATDTEGELVMYFTRVFNNEFFVELNNKLYPFGMNYVYYFRFGANHKLQYVNCFLIEN